MKRKAAPYNSRQRKLIQEINKNQRSREHTNYVKRLNREQVAASKLQLENRESEESEETIDPLPAPEERKRRKPEKAKAQLPRLKLPYELQMMGRKECSFEPEFKVDHFEYPNPFHWVDCDFCRKPVSSQQCIVSSCFGVPLHYHPNCLASAVQLKH